jgi:hypothetical protein
MLEWIGDNRMKVMWFVEYRRLTGENMQERKPWPFTDLSVVEARSYSRETLKTFYTGDESHFWPREVFRDRAPEEVRIVGEAGNVVAAYTIRDVTQDTSRTLIGIP